MQAWQNGMRLPVSSVRKQIRHGAGTTIEASASHIPRKYDRTELAGWPTVHQAYPLRVSMESKIWHDSCHPRCGTGFSL